MACNLTLNSIPRDCESSIGGVKRVLFVNHDQLGKITVDETTGMVKAIDGGGKFEVVNLKKGAASLATAMNVGDGGKQYTSTLTINFGKMTASKRLHILPLLANELAAIVEDNNGNYWLAGKDVPLEASANDSNTGTAVSDANGYTVTMTDTSLEIPLAVDPSIVEGLIKA